MLYNIIPSRRIQVLQRILTSANQIVNNTVRAYVSSDTISIGNVVTKIYDAKRPEYVPGNYYTDDLSQSNLHHLRWMMQKDLLGQDMFLLGPPGPQKRTLAMQYLEMTNREHEYVALSRDTTESDLKQRREIVQGTAKYFDQSAVRAATEGRILIIEGIEKAERNVLPVLNNLLENREMHLEDGRLLIAPTQYDKLLEQYGEMELEKWKLIRVSENFRVIALGLPVPKYRGNPLDPPLRSRFQARDVHLNGYQEWYEEILSVAENAPIEKIEKILSCAFAICTKDSAQVGLPDFPMNNLIAGAKILDKYPKLTEHDILIRLYPYKTLLDKNLKHFESLLNTFKIETISNESENIPVKPSIDYIENNYQNKLISDMVQTECAADFCVIGPKGCGKTLLVQQVAEIVGKETETIVLYHDMTARDLVQQRATLDNGDTIWKLSPLVYAALEGKIAILDGINRIHPSTFSVLHRLIHDRELHLHDGKRLINHLRYDELKEKFNYTDQQLQEKGILKVHPDFRIVAIGEPPNLQSPAGNWLSPEILTLFVFHEVRPLSKLEEMHIITSKYGPISKELMKIIELAHTLRNSSDQTLKNLSGHLSTRQLLRIAARIKNFPSSSTYDTIQTTFMVKFLPSLTRQALERIVEKMEILPDESSFEDDKIKCEIKDNTLTIGKSSIPIHQTADSAKIPRILFYEIPQHLQLMERMMQDFQLGQHLLLVGNQGVGKNKIVDRFLELMNRPREYIQLHRDTTVQTLTLQSSIKDGLLVHEDSPLVKAAKYGHVLVVDEADKAPTHVTCILKSLVESGEMILNDGRRLVRTLPKNAEKCVQIHPDFRVIVLANRPGFPFLGNDFFAALGDLFSSYAVENPSFDSEIALLRQYGPNVPMKTLENLVKVFGELRNMADQGLINYPYSTREVVNIVKHINTFPDTDLDDVVLNVFDFDKYSPDVVQTLLEVFEKHGLPLGSVLTTQFGLSKKAKEQLQVTVKRWSGLDATAPKHGKEDPKNAPHVGGNTWAGGSGGRDTAGLGGKGGPYRLDKGHKVFQLSDQEKDELPEHIKKAAREMNRKAFQEKLKEIGMSEYDASLYNQFYDSVQHQIQSLRVVLGNLQAKNKERNWMRHQTGGELDDVKLIDGLLGEKNVFKRRTEQQPELGAPQLKPKIFRVLVDVSGSMYRFNGYDGRLDRELETVVLVMESFEGFHDKIQYDIIGHSGDTPSVTFVKLKEPPKNNKERLKVIRLMHAHSQFCWSGDHTLEGTQMAINSLADEECDEAILIVLSDANLQRYGIPPSQLASVLTSKPEVSAYVIFIGGLGNEAERLTANLPAGRGFVCEDVNQLPNILKQIFASSIIRV